MSRKPYNKYFLLCFVFFIFFSCNDPEKQIKKEMERFLGTSIRFPENLIPLYPEQSLTLSGLYKAKYKTIFYLDSNKCTDCSFKALYPFNDYYKKYDRRDAPVLLIINSNDIHMIRDLMYLYFFSIPAFLDVNNEFKTLNPQFPANPKLRTFLLKNDRVILCGNPAANTHVRELYLRETNSQ